MRRDRPWLSLSEGQQRVLWGQMKALAMRGAEHRGVMPLRERFSYEIWGKKPGTSC